MQSFSEVIRSFQITHHTLVLHEYVKRQNIYNTSNHINHNYFCPTCFISRTTIKGTSQAYVLFFFYTVFAKCHVLFFSKWFSLLQHLNLLYSFFNIMRVCLSQWQRGLRRWSAAARLQGLRVRMPPWAWVSVCCECWLWAGRGLCVGLITRPKESYRVWFVQCVWSRSP